MAAAGISAATRTYGLVDAALPEGVGTLYYRLRQVDLDGSYTFSPVRAVRQAGQAAGLSLFPNPAQEASTTLLGATAGTSVRVLDALGRPVATATADAAGIAQLTLPAGLASGVYSVHAGSRALRLLVK